MVGGGDGLFWSVCGGLVKCRVRHYPMLEASHAKRVVSRANNGENLGRHTDGSLRLSKRMFFGRTKGIDGERNPLY